MRRPTLVPFDGTPPAVRAGDQVDIRDAFGRWRRVEARSEPRYDEVNALGGRCYLTVAAPMPDGSVVNWPAEDVRITSDNPEESRG